MGLPTRITHKPGPGRCINLGTTYPRLHEEAHHNSPPHSPKALELEPIYLPIRMHRCGGMVEWYITIQGKEWLRHKQPPAVTLFIRTRGKGPGRAAPVRRKQRNTRHPKQIAIAACQQSQMMTTGTTGEPGNGQKIPCQKMQRPRCPPKTSKHFSFDPLWWCLL